jgi:hypothetical protein
MDSKDGPACSNHAMPMLAPVGGKSFNARLTMAKTFSVAATAAAQSSWGKMITNSSPPSRATKSLSLVRVQVIANTSATAPKEKWHIDNLVMQTACNAPLAQQVQGHPGRHTSSSSKLLLKAPLCYSEHSLA